MSACGRRPSITQHYHPESSQTNGEHSRLESLRDSLLEIRGSISELANLHAKDEEEGVRLRSKSQGILASAVAIEKQEVKRRRSSVIKEAAQVAVTKAVDGVTGESKRRMSLALQQLPASRDPDAHDDDPLSKTGVDFPEWQLEHRERKKSVANDAVERVGEKKSVRRRGSSVATEASRSAVFKGVAAHD